MTKQEFFYYISKIRREKEILGELTQKGEISDYAFGFLLRELYECKLNLYDYYCGSVNKDGEPIDEETINIIIEKKEV